MLILGSLTIERSVVDAQIPTNIFIVLAGFTTDELAHTSDSLIRVSRRGEWNHLATKKHKHT